MGGGLTRPYNERELMSWSIEYIYLYKLYI